MTIRSAPDAPSSFKRRAAWVLRIILFVIFVGAGIANLAGYAPFAAEFDKIGWGQWLRYVTALCQIVGGLLLLKTAVAPLGESVLICITIGAFFAQLLAIRDDVIHTFVLLAMILALVWFDRNTWSRLITSS